MTTRAHPEIEYRACAGLRACAGVLLTMVSCASAGDMKEYPTPYYLIYSDLDIDSVREAAVRMTAMAEEYHQRTRGFSGTISKKLPFYLFRSVADYSAAGGPAGSIGVYTGKKLMAFAGDSADERTWHTVQHEGFHQFAYAVIRGDLPVWVSEGLAEYFGEGLFTGDLFIVGVIHPVRLSRLKKEFNAGQLKPLREMMAMDAKAWNTNISSYNYDQAWSMIHFLVHGDNGKYVRALSGFINDIGGGTSHEQSWTRNFGRDVDGFERKWKEYWQSLPENPTPDLYTKAIVATMTSYFARAFSQRQTYAEPADFFKAGASGELKAHREDWLPPALLKEALGRVRSAGEWSIDAPPGRTPRLICESPTGTKFVGTFALNAAKVGHVNVEMIVKEESATPATGPVKPGPPTTRAAPPATGPVPPKETATPPAEQPTPPAPEPLSPPADMLPNAINLARAYQSVGEKDKARTALEEALKQYPNSPHAAEARKLLAELK